jgi:hypothetical protein
MTKNRETKTKVHQAATSTKPVLSQSPRERATYGRHLPLELGQKLEASAVRGNRTYGRTRDRVVADKVKARRGAGIIRKLIG